jgi:hypothetical protein
MKKCKNKLIQSISPPRLSTKSCGFIQETSKYNKQFELEYQINYLDDKNPDQIMISLLQEFYSKNDTREIIWIRVQINFKIKNRDKIKNNR